MLWNCRFEGEKGEKSELDILAGKYCRVISKVSELVDSESEEVFYDFGTLKDVDYEDNFILVEIKSGLKRIRIDAIYNVMFLRNCK